MASHIRPKIHFFLNLTNRCRMPVHRMLYLSRPALQFSRKILSILDRSLSLKRRALPVIPGLAVVHAWGWGTNKNESAKDEGSSTQLSEEENLIKKADELYDNNDILTLYELLLPHKDCSNDAILWRLARAACDKGKLASTDAPTKKTLTFEAFEYVRRALEIDDSNFASHKWYAILLDCTGTYEGTKARITKAYLVKEHLQKAIKLNPNDATSIHSLGYWCFLFADMAWYERKIASAVFGTPPTSSYEEALKYFLDAETVDPNFYSTNLLMLGKTYLRMGNKESAKLYLTRTTESAVVTEDDKKAHKEATELLKSL